MAKKHPGKCALCGKLCDDLSFEHIPPQASFNSTPVKPVNILDLTGDDSRLPWESEGLPYLNLQKGMGVYSLCESCNNHTGGWYGEAYASFARAAHNFLSHPDSYTCEGVMFTDIYPARIIKQVISMFCSLNDNETPEMDGLRRFVLDKNAVGIDRNNFKVCMFLTRSAYKRHIPMMADFRFDTSDNSTETILISEITGYPFGFILYCNPLEISKFEGIDITSFTDCQYDQITDFPMPICIKEVNSMFPLDYRTREKIVQDKEETLEQLKKQSELLKE